MRVDVVPDRFEFVVEAVQLADAAEQRLFDGAHGIPLCWCVAGDSIPAA
jgi:hypothetical protein